MKGLPVTVRLLDPPMHEFLPTAAQLELEIAHLHHLRDTHQGAGGAAGHAASCSIPKLYQQYADGLTKLQDEPASSSRNRTCDDDVIARRK